MRALLSGGAEPAGPFIALRMDTLIPFVNTRFLWAYIALRGGYLDVLAAGASPAPGLFLRSPGLLVKAFFGYFFDTSASMIVTFRRAV